MKKKDKIIAGTVSLYFVTALCIYCVKMNAGPGPVQDIPQQSEQPVAEGIPVLENTAGVEDSTENADTAANILIAHSLPSLDRMEPEDQEQYVNHLAVIQRIAALGLDVNDMLCPGTGIIRVEEALGQLGSNADVQGERMVFDGTASEELQRLIDAHTNVVIDIVSEQIEVTDKIVLHAGTVINGNGVQLNTHGTEYCFYAESADNISVRNICIDGGTGYGICCMDCNNIELTGNRINRCEQKAISITGTTDGLIVRENELSDNLSGTVYLAGNVSDGLIEANTIRNNHGNDSSEAGIALADTIQNAGPHNLIIRNNKIEDNHAAGIYFDGAYLCYVLNNTISGNDKEGIRLSNGTLGVYLGRNTLRLNGRRENKTDDELQVDLVLDAGRMEDGSSKAKLPGIRLDNSAYNILENNTILGNYGGGIDMPHTAVRNIILGNVIRDNNAGQNDMFGFYGIALKTDASDVEYAGADFTADFENIICRNIISGNHYSGIFIDEACYINDVFDNIVMDAQVCGIEAVSLKFNSIINNTTNCGVSIAFQ